MEALVIFGTIVSLATILYGVRSLKTSKRGNLKKAIFSSVSVFSLAIMGMFAFVVMGSPVFASEAAQGVATVVTVGAGLKYLSAALSTGLATIGTGMAVGSVGSSAIGAVSEDPSIFGKTLVFVGMAEGIAIYGMIISILILFV